jgi:hypoxia up-regulated 1
LLGRLYGDPIAEEYRKTYDNTMVKDDVRATCTFEHDKSSTYSVEELVAMQLSHAKQQAEIYANEPIKDAVITVSEHSIPCSMLQCIESFTCL